VLALICCSKAKVGKSAFPPVPALSLQRFSITYYMFRRRGSQNPSSSFTSEASSSSLIITKLSARQPSPARCKYPSLALENQLLRCSIDTLQKVSCRQTLDALRRMYETCRRQVRRLREISYCFRLQYSGSQQEIGGSWRSLGVVGSSDERSENKALKSTLRQLNHQIATLRVSLCSLKQEYSTLKSHLVSFALRRRWRFLPANFSAASVSFHDLVAVYLRAGYRPRALTPSEILKLPVEPADETLSEEHCCVCLCPFESVVKRLPCGHCFHVVCIGRWLGLRNSCPLCVGEVLVS